MAVAGAYQVEIGWQGAVTGLFVIDTSTLDGTDVLGSPLPAGFVAEDDMTDRCVLVNYRRGRDSNMGAFTMGTCTLTFSDPDQDLNPANGSSPFAGYLELKRPVRVRATHSATWVEGGPYGEGAYGEEGYGD